MHLNTQEIVRRANELVDRYGTRDPVRLADELEIEVVYFNFQRQRGVYKQILGIPHIFVNRTLYPVEQIIVLLHELGHDQLHRDVAAVSGEFKEFNLFQMNSRLEYEANVFAAQIELDDEQFLEYCEKGYDMEQIARSMHSDINLVALKADTLIAQGYRLRRQEHRNDFLHYSKKSMLQSNLDWDE